MPGSPESDESNPTYRLRRPLHPCAALLSFVLIGAGLSLTRAPLALAASALLALALALRVEGKRLRAEAPFLGLAALLFAAHLLFAGRPLRDAAPPAASIALRLLALVYLTRWAARAFLPRAARWLFARRGPRRPRLLALLFESGRMTLALLPLALREAERQHHALRARGIRAGRGARSRARYLAAWLLPYLGTMLRVGDAYGEALHARGYRLGGIRRASTRTPWGILEVAAVAASSAALIWFVRAR